MTLRLRILIVADLNWLEHQHPLEMYLDWTDGLAKSKPLESRTVSRVPPRHARNTLHAADLTRFVVPSFGTIRSFSTRKSPPIIAVNVCGLCVFLLHSQHDAAYTNGAVLLRCIAM